MGIHNDWEDAYNDDVDSENEESENEETLAEVAASAFITLVGVGVAAVGAAAYEASKNFAPVIAEKMQEENRIEAEKERAKQERIQRKKNRRADFWGKHWKAVIISILILGLFLFAAYRVSEYRKLTSVGYAAHALQGQAYESVVSDLKESGFTKISVEELKDLSLENEGESGTVAEVVIDGKSRFDATEKFPYDAKITVFYHSLKMVSPPFSSEDIKGMSRTSALDQLKSAEFINIEEEPLYDVVLGWFSKEDEVETIMINGKNKFNPEDSFRPDVKVIVQYHALRKNNR